MAEAEKPEANGDDWRTKMQRAPLPVDRVAARVVFGKGEQWAPKAKAGISDRGIVSSDDDAAICQVRLG